MSKNENGIEDTSLGRNLIHVVVTIVEDERIKDHASTKNNNIKRNNDLARVVKMIRECKDLGQAPLKVLQVMSVMGDVESRSSSN